MDEFIYRRVNPARPVASYVGGKKALAKQVIAAIDAIPHRTYAEPFVGMGGIFLRRETVPAAEVINDRSRDVATLFRVLQRHYQALMDMLRWQLTSRAEFERLLAQEGETLTDLERAARFLYVQRLGFGGRVAGRTFGVSTGMSARFDVTKLAAVLEAAHERLAGVWIECLPWEQFLPRWDREDTLFYLDPPYWGSEDYYGDGAFERSEFAAMAAALKKIRGAFVLSVNDVAELRALFNWADVRSVGVTYQVGGTPSAARELIICSPGIDRSRRSPSTDGRLL